MKLKTAAAEVYFNPQLISHLTLGSDHALLTMHFINGTQLACLAETDEERMSAAELLRQLNDEHSGFISVGNELLNCRSALWIEIPADGPVVFRMPDNRTKLLDDADRQRISKVLAE